MRYADCYMRGDIEGHPSSTYLLDMPNGQVDKAVKQLKNSFDRVVITQESNGQSPIALSGIYKQIVAWDSTPTLQNAMRGARA